MMHIHVGRNRFHEVLAMAEFDYHAAAELFPTRRRQSKRQRFGYKRFADVAAAIRFAIEDVPAEYLSGAFLEVDELRYGSDDIRRLYEDSNYPLTRRRAQS
jgi:NAD(P)-dependent dehydrogenase (short-subunit alcohol dehydrogenase family)